MTDIPDGVKVLDATCASRMFWFDKENPLAFYIDSRQIDPIMVGKDHNARGFSVSPDKVMDFRNMDFPDNSFWHTVFDPPHLVRAGKQSYMAMKYGKLDRDTWRQDLKKGFDECWRVTKTNGTIIFKWNEYQVPVGEVLKAIGRSPLYGHRSNRSGHTIWMCFLKVEELAYAQ